MAIAWTPLQPESLESTVQMTTKNKGGGGGGRDGRQGADKLEDTEFYTDNEMVDEVDFYTNKEMV
jgi:hypothetical protein